MQRSRRNKAKLFSLVAFPSSRLCLLEDVAATDQAVRRHLNSEHAAEPQNYLSLAVFNAHLKTHLFSISCGATAHL